MYKRQYIKTTLEGSLWEGASVMLSASFQNAQYQEHYLILNVFQSIIVLDVGIELSPIYTYKKITKIMPKSDQSLKYKMCIRDR